MNVFAGKQRHHFLQNVFEKVEGGIFSVVNIFVDAPIGGNHEWWVSGNAKLGIRRQRRRGVARHFDFRHDGHAALGGVGHDFAYILLRVIATVQTRFAGSSVNVGVGSSTRRYTPCADRG